MQRKCSIIQTPPFEFLLDRTQLLGQLRASGFVRARGGGDIRDLNTNSENWAVVKAALCAGMYPNVIRVNRARMILTTMWVTGLVMCYYMILLESRCSRQVGFDLRSMLHGLNILSDFKGYGNYHYKALQWALCNLLFQKICRLQLPSYMFARKEKEKKKFRRLLTRLLLWQTFRCILILKRKLKILP